MPKFYIIYCLLVVVGQVTSLHYGYLWHDTTDSYPQHNSGYYGGGGGGGGYYTGVGTSYHK